MTPIYACDIDMRKIQDTYKYEKDFMGNLAERERKLKESGVRDVFTPARPVMSQELFFGTERRNDLKRLIGHLNTPGQHILLYGERGVGKSSLANIASQAYCSLTSAKSYFKGCDSSTTFHSLIEDALMDAGVDITITEIESTRSGETTAKAGACGLEIGGKREKEIAETREGPAANPAIAAEMLTNLEGLLIIDEADALDQSTEKRNLSSFIKHLSDNDSLFKLIIVGVAETGDELIEKHPSISRCLQEIILPRMKDYELAEIINGGAIKLNLSFNQTVVEKIVDLSAGYPYFTHLLALKCSEDAIVEGRKNIESAHLERAISETAKSSIGVLGRKYEEAIRSQTGMYKEILCAAASITKQEFAARDLRQAIHDRTGENYDQGLLNNYLKKLVSTDDSTILYRVAKGVYRFNDPRMPSCIRIITKDFD
jgi:hypothetical protein